MIKKAEEAKQPRAQTTLWDIPMDSTKAVITFSKGDPTELSQDQDEWVYKLPSQCLLLCSRDKVNAYGIYDPRPGPIRFVKEKKRVKKSR